MAENADQQGDAQFVCDLLAEFAELSSPAAFSRPEFGIDVANFFLTNHLRTVKHCAYAQEYQTFDRIGAHGANYGAQAVILTKSRPQFTGQQFRRCIKKTVLASCGNGEFHDFRHVLRRRQADG